MSTLERTLLFPLLGVCFMTGCGSSLDRTTLKPDAQGFIPWVDAKRAILSGEVVAVAQNHDRVVWITLKDDTTYMSRENQLDEVIDFIEKNNLRASISI